MDKYQKAIYDIRNNLKCVSRQLCNVTEVVENANLEDIADTFIEINNNITNLQDQIDDIEASESSPSFSNSPEFAI